MKEKGGKKETLDECSSFNSTQPSSTFANETNVTQKALAPVQIGGLVSGVLIDS